MNRLIIFTIMSVLLTGCIYTSMSHLNEEELSWVSPYSADTTIIFISNKGNIDTLRYESRYIYNSRNPFFFNTASDGVYDAYAIYEFIINNSDTTFDGHFSMLKDGETDITGVYFNLGSSFSDNYDNKNNPVPLKQLVKDVVINDIRYPDCIIADSTNMHANSKQIMFTKFIFSRTDGLIYYKYYDGEVFIRK